MIEDVLSFPGPWSLYGKQRDQNTGKHYLLDGIATSKESRFSETPES